MKRLICTTALTLLAGQVFAQTAPVQPDYTTADFSAPQANPWFPLIPGPVATLIEVADDDAGAGDDDDTDEDDGEDDDGAAGTDDDDQDDADDNEDDGEDDGDEEDDDEDDGDEEDDDEDDGEEADDEDGENDVGDDTEEGDEDQSALGTITVTIAVQGAGPVILGVPTTAVLEEEFAGSTLLERTVDYYANDADGNVWFFGEAVENYRYDDAGALTGSDTKGSWMAGDNGALPGIAMPGTPVVGMSLFAEQAPADEAVDVNTIDAMGLSVDGFADVMRTVETSPADPSLHDVRYFARDAGLIRVEEGTPDSVETTLVRQP